MDTKAIDIPSRCPNVAVLQSQFEPFNGTFGWALWKAANGHTVTRQGWNGAGQYIALQGPDEGSKMKKPYLYMSPVDGEFVPWVASQTDILATDWVCGPTL